MDEPTLTQEEMDALQHYALASISRDPEKHAEKNSLIETVIYFWQEFMKPAPPAVKEHVKSELSNALNNWRTA